MVADSTVHGQWSHGSVAVGEGGVRDVPFGVQRVAADARRPSAGAAYNGHARKLALLLVGEVHRSENVEFERMQERDRRAAEQVAI